MRIILFLTLSTLFLFCENNTTTYEDIYLLKAFDGNCTLSKNGKTIPSFDPKLGKKQPHSDYSCFAMQKEKYTECSILERKNITAFLMAYGSYEKTNLLIAFKTPHKSVKSSVSVACTKKLKKR